MFSYWYPNMIVNLLVYLLLYASLSSLSLSCDYIINILSCTIKSCLISEYVQIAQGFFSGKEPGLANATLDALARALHPEAFEETVAADG